MKTVEIPPFQICFFSDHLVENLKPIVDILNQIGVDTYAWDGFWDENDLFPEEGVVFYYDPKDRTLDYYTYKGDSSEIVSVEKVMNGLVSNLPHLTFEYRNYKGKVSVREVITPVIHVGCSEYHNEGKPTWLMTAFDLEKKALRDYQMSDILKIEEGSA